MYDQVRENLSPIMEVFMEKEKINEQQLNEAAGGNDPYHNLSEKGKCKDAAGVQSNDF